MNLSIITGGENCPDMIVTQSDSTIIGLKSSLGFENNIDLKTKWKANQYKEMLNSVENKFYQPKYGGPWVQLEFIVT